MVYAAACREQGHDIFVHALPEAGVHLAVVFAKDLSPPTIVMLGDARTVGQCPAILAIGDQEAGARLLEAGLISAWLPDNVPQRLVLGAIHALAGLVMAPPPATHGGVFRSADLVVDFDRREARTGGVPVALTRAQYVLLATLAHRPGEIVTHRALFYALYGHEPLDNDQARDSVKVHLFRLRARLLESAPNLDVIESVRGVGYRFERRPRAV